METLVSNWSKTTRVLPENYVFPVGQRPGSVEVPICHNIPLIDLGQSQSQIIQEILHACQEFGFFQVINHGVSKDLSDDTMKVVQDLYNMPDEEKAKVLKLDVVGKYSLEMRKLSLRMLELIREGLGLEPGYFGEELTATQLLSINLYPPCPNPGLTLGLPKYADPNLISVLLQGSVYVLQVFKNGRWLGVDPLLHAFVVDIGNQLKIISNAERRAVTNSNKAISEKVLLVEST